MSALKDEHGKFSSTRFAGFLFVLLFTAVVISEVWFDRTVRDIIYETLEWLISALVVGVTVRGASKTFKQGGGDARD